jgi:hypothetical protein
MSWTIFSRAAPFSGGLIERQTGILVGNEPLGLFGFKTIIFKRSLR